MKAVLLSGHGGPEMLRYGEAPDPVAGPGEVVVDIHAASVNAADYKVRLGSGVYSKIRFPHILGRDFSGVIGVVGAGVGDLAVGDAVFGVTDQGIEGAYAEKIAIKAAIVAKKPDRLGHAEAGDPAAVLDVERLVDVAEHELLAGVDHDVVAPSGQVDLAVDDLAEVARAIESVGVDDRFAADIAPQRVGAADP